ncbi:MAG: hypothetical protein QF733_02325 [Phycisphaerales bacterium]|nr:hypothetical protein [Phycisphaerales bacterium]
MWIQTTLQTMAVAVCSAGMPAAANGVPAASGCYWVSSGFDMLACRMPPQVCPNGFFTGVETCAAATSHAGCQGRRQASGYWGDEPTGRSMRLTGCGDVGATYAVMACRCTGNILGWCAGPCEPAGGVVQAEVACPGSIRRVFSCDELSSER